MKRRALLLLTAAAITSCSLLGPSPRRIVPWFELPEPGTVYTYTVTTTWHDTSQTVEQRTFLVERVEEGTDEIITVKLADEEHLISRYWLVSIADDAIYESTDAEIDDGDRLLLKVPVEEGERWSSGPSTDQIDYEIDRIRSSLTTDAGEFTDVVDVVCDYDARPGLETIIQWAPDAGLLTYTEDYDPGASYIDTYERVLTALSSPQ